MADNARMIIESRIRETVEKYGPGMRLSSECLDTLNGEIDALIKLAVRRAQENGRKTVQTQDF